MSCRIPPQSGEPAPARTPQAAPGHNIIDLRQKPCPAAPDETTVPSHRKNARAYLEGTSPGVMQSYAPNARPSPTEGWVEDDETVHRLMRWREEAIE